MTRTGRREQMQAEQELDTLQNEIYQRVAEVQNAQQELKLCKDPARAALLQSRIRVLNTELHTKEQDLKRRRREVEPMIVESIRQEGKRA